jgi:hypothetical protein
MDGFRFDQLARNLVTQTDRRRVLHGVSGLVAALLGATIGREATEAKHSKHRVHGERNTGGGKPSSNCPAGRVKCRGQCVNLDNNRQNCGQCANVCSESETCCQGRCVTGVCSPGTCAAGQDYCSQGLEATKCGDLCNCFTTVGGATFCALGGPCVPCDSDDDCTAIPGSACVVQTGNALCGCPGPGNCLAPCNS